MAYFRKSWVILGLSTASALALAIGCGVRDGDDGESAGANLSQSPDLVISQVFTHGGAPEAKFKQDFVELFNRGTAKVNLEGKGLQFASAEANFEPTKAVALPNFELHPGQYYLVKLKGGGDVGEDLRASDHAMDFELDVDKGKIAIVKMDAPLSDCGGVSTSADGGRLIARCPAEDTIDLVGYGAASDFEGNKPAQKTSTKISLQRADKGCSDKGDNKADFAWPQGTDADAKVPNPRTKDSPKNECTAVAPPLDAGADADGAADATRPPEQDSGKDSGPSADSGRDAGRDSGRDSGKDSGKKPKDDAGDDDDQGDDDDGADDTFNEDPIPSETKPKPKKAPPLKVGSSDCAMTSGPIDNSSGISLGLGLAFALVSVGARRRSRKSGNPSNK